MLCQVFQDFPKWFGKTVNDKPEGCDHPLLYYVSGWDDWSKTSVFFSKTSKESWSQHQCEGIGEVLQLPRFYCEEQSLEGIICWLVDTFVVYCIHVEHTFEDYITQQTYVQQCNAQSAVLLNCGLHLD